MGMGEERSLLYDPGSELYYWEGESSASITINGMVPTKKRSKVSALLLLLL